MTLLLSPDNEFEGGDLCLQHNGITKKCEWSSNSKTKHQWVAFYGDCLHWIENVISGTRITLTFNMFLEKKEELTTQVGEYFKNYIKISLNLHQQYIFSRPDHKMYTFFFLMFCQYLGIEHGKDYRFRL